jgi:hypothetical protein
VQGPNRSRCVLWLQKQQLKRLGASQERSVASEAADAASGSAARAFYSLRSSSCSVWKRRRSVAGAFCGLASSSSSVRRRCRSVLWLRKQQLQCPGAMEPACPRCSTCPTCWERCRSVLWPQKGSEPVCTIIFAFPCNRQCEEDLREESGPRTELLRTRRTHDRRSTSEGKRGETSYGYQPPMGSQRPLELKMYWVRSGKG